MPKQEFVPEIEWRSPENLTPYFNNTKSHPTEQIDKIASSIAEFAFDQPIVVDEKGVIIKGHGRREAALRLSLSQVPVIVRADLSEAQKKAARIADNKVAESEWLEDKLKAELEELGELEYDLNLTGFGDDEIAQLLEGMNGSESMQGDGDVDDVPDVDEVEPRVKLGEIWQLGDRHKILCGDSTDEVQVKKLLGNALPTFIWSDSPYGFGLMRDGSTGRVGNSRVYTAIANDQDTNVARKAIQLCKQFECSQIWWGANYFADALPPSKCWIVWDKDHHGMTFADAELAWVNVDSPVRCFRHAWSGNHRDSEQREQRVHVNQKPVALAEWCFEKYGKPDDIIFDPFLGSGISIIAAQKMEGDRTVFGCELSPEYCSVVLERYERFTGDVAKLISQAE